jgi:hypothetical protein
MAAMATGINEGEYGSRQDFEQWVEGVCRRLQSALYAPEAVGDEGR